MTLRQPPAASRQPPAKGIKAPFRSGQLASEEFIILIV